MKSKFAKTLTTALVAVVILSGCSENVNKTELPEEQEETAELEDTSEEEELPAATEKPEATDDTTLEDNNSDKNGEVPEDESVEIKTFSQPDGELFKLEDVALESYEVEDLNVKNAGKAFEYDLDGDGNIETITVVYCGVDEFDKVDAKLLVDGEEIFIFPFYGGIVYIVDLNKDDDSLEVVTFDLGPSDDPNYKIFKKQGSEMINVGEVEIGGGVKIDQKGRFYGYGEVGTVNLFLYCYELENDYLEEYEPDAKEVENVWYTGGGYFTTDLANETKWMNEGLDGYVITLPANTKFLLLDYIDKATIKIQLEDGEVGYLLGWHHFGD